jgi:aspartyl protease family protein
MAIIAWIIGMLLLTQLFGAWEEDQINPNRDPEYASLSGEHLVTLQQNRQGHYLVTGTINQKEAVFMLDTGATDVVIPQRLGDRYGLQAMGFGTGITANGLVDFSHTRIAELRIGAITLYDVDASLNPGMDEEMPILLGMSALRRLEMTQKDHTLILRQNN